MEKKKEKENEQITSMHACTKQVIKRIFDNHKPLIMIMNFAYMPKVQRKIKNFYFDSKEFDPQIMILL